MVLSQMDRDDAMVFKALCSLSVEMDGDCAPVIEYERSSEYEKWGITFEKIVNLTALGLIESELTALSGGYVMKFDNPNIKIKYFDCEYELHESIKEVKLGHVIFTKTGQALCKAIMAEKMKNFG